MSQSVSPPAPRLVYTPEYDIHFMGLENLHPFDSRKYSRAWSVLFQEFGKALSAITLTPTAPIELATLQQVHKVEYLESLKFSRHIARALELGSLSLLPAGILNRRVLKPMQLATRGTLMAAEAALTNRIAINLGGGYHHASADRGEGFCVYADVAVAIAHLRQTHQLAPEDAVLIIDLDAHQGNGLARIFEHDPTVYILDMYNRDIYPQDPIAKQRVNCNLPIRSGTNDGTYLAQLREEMLAFLRSIPHPKIAFYNAGTDIYEEDPLGRLRVSEQGILERDRFVFQTLTDAGIPWVMVLSGGYTRKSYEFVASSVAYVLRTWGDPSAKPESYPA
jgi:histone deacetylase 11